MVEFHCLHDYILEHSENIDEIKSNYLELMQDLTHAPDVSTYMFTSTIENIHKMGRIIIGISDNLIVCSGTIIIEPKIIHGCKAAGHIEDIVVMQSWRGKDLGQTLIDNLSTYGFNNDCYKIILDCNDNLEVFYNKSGFSKKGLQMSLYK